MKTINQLCDEIKEKAREYSNCEDVPNCSNCSWMPDDDMQNSCSNRLEYKAFVKGANYMRSYNEAIRWIPFEEEKPFINDYVLVRTNLYPLVKPRVKRVTSRVDLSKKYSHWKAI